MPSDQSACYPADRDLARRRGLKHYYTGKPCKNGHRSERLVSNGMCVTCVRNKRTEGRGAYLRYQQDYYRRRRGNGN